MQFSGFFCADNSESTIGGCSVQDLSTDNLAGSDRPLLDIEGLRTYFYTEDGVVKAVDGVDFSVNRGEIFGLVGESGCGKSVTALSILGLIDSPGKIVDGKVLFNQLDLRSLSEKELTGLRGSRISMIFQQPQSSLNPVFTLGDQVAEVLQIHQKMNKAEASEKAVNLLGLVGIPDPEARAKSYPHEISGGQAQRVMIAMALALNPQLLIADEPTTALDVTIQAQILDLVRDLSSRWNTAVILITHDLGVVAEMVDRVAVMYAGRIVEQTDVKMLFDKPLHPYTQGLIASIPVLGRVTERLEVIPGSVPNLVDMPVGCRFAARCQARVEHDLKICAQREPNLIDIQHNHKVRCWLYQSHADHQAPLRVY
jgi:oligopeptide/dipeptide ABC transporter ATP-binding protein